MCPHSPGVLSSTSLLYSFSRMAMIRSAIPLTSPSLMLAGFGDCSSHSPLLVQGLVAENGANKTGAAKRQISDRDIDIVTHWTGGLE